eukprot:m.68433 g.68433  ORF g.68433 m.68433 type:complete len:421 (-) comp12197_c0_seq1:140-1402(-)
MEGSLSKRGHHYLHEGPEWLGPLIECISKAGENPDMVNLGVAENCLCHAEMLEKLTQLRTQQPIVKSSFSYYQFEGIKRFREAIAATLNEALLKVYVSDASQVLVGNGVGPLLEAMVSVIADAGDVILVPAPYYHAFVLDLCRRLDVEIEPVPLELTADNDMVLTTEAVVAAYDKATKAGKHVAALLYTNPHNPSGCTFTADTSREVMKWCVDQKLHFISDEIYAYSTYADTTREFVSALDLLPELKQQSEDASTFIHMFWGFSKDFGLNGFRVGILVSENTAVRQALAALAYFFSTPADVQELCAAMLEDKAFVKSYFVMNSKRLRDANTQVVSALQELGVTSIVNSHAGMFVYFKPPFDLDTVDAERAYWLKLARERDVMMLPGFVFEDPRRGWFRICSTACPVETTIAALQRALAPL